MRFRITIFSYLSLTLCFFGSQSVFAQESQQIVIDSNFDASGVFTTRYQFSTNCFPIRKGEHYTMLNLYGPEVHFAVHKDLSIGLMTSWLASPIALALKYTRGTPNPKINYGVGALVGSLGLVNAFNGYGGLYWGMLTLGDRRTNITFSAGFGHFNDQNYATTPREIYIPGIYPAVNGQYPDIPVQEIIQFGGNSAFQAPVLGIAAQAKISGRSSVFLDCMLFLSKDYSNYVDGYQSEVSHYGYDNNFNYTLQEVEVTPWTYYNNGPGPDEDIFVIMPGYRFERNANSAFQGSAVILFSQEFLLPLPMFSYFYKF